MLLCSNASLLVNDGIDDMVNDRVDDRINGRVNVRLNDGLSDRVPPTQQHTIEACLVIASTVFNTMCKAMQLMHGCCVVFLPAGA